jgi:NAD(P)-dependent dehydrogenase (short-subunit alcohol dehydrogenase family)
VALVTGASRGIGKAIAVHLAGAGLDVAIGARTRHEGEAREHSSTVAASDMRPLPGSLDTTAALVEKAGARALPVALDLLDRVSLGSAVTTVLERWGRIDVLVNNGRYVGPGHMDRLLDTPVELLDRHLEANVMAPVILTRLVLPGMVERGAGVVINLASTSGRMDPPAPAGEGAGGSATACPRGPCTGWPASWPWSWARSGCWPSTSAPGSWPPSGSPWTWPASASTLPPGRRPTWSGRWPPGW